MTAGDDCCERQFVEAQADPAKACTENAHKAMPVKKFASRTRFLGWLISEHT